MTLFSVVAAFLFAAWFILTIAGQFPRVRVKLAHIDILGVIPLWTFFAPNPGVSDYRLLYRQRTAGGSMGVWREMNVQSKSGVYRAIWNPIKRENKALTDMVMDLSRLVTNGHPEGIFISIPYIGILNAVSAVSRSALNDAVQFLILETCGYEGFMDNSSIVFLSSIHRIESG